MQQLLNYLLYNQFLIFFLQPQIDVYNYCINSYLILFLNRFKIKKLFQIDMEKPLQIVITGATGFVAKNLRKYLSESNVNLISISRKNFKNFKNETKIISKTYSEKSLLPKN